jgi:hypothetical protein
MNVVERLMDRVRHPGETNDQRAMRRYRSTLDRFTPAGPYVLSTARRITAAEYEQAVKDDRQRVMAAKVHATVRPPIVGVRIESIK